MAQDRTGRELRDELLETMFGGEQGRPGPGDPPEEAERHAREMRADARYQERPWDEVESDLRREWEGRHPDAPWGGAREAIRGAWERETDQAPPGAESEETLQLREEELAARRRTVEAGEVEIRKEVVTETRTVEVPVRREQLVIERRDGRGTVGEPIRVPLSEGPPEDGAGRPAE